MTSSLARQRFLLGLSKTEFLMVILIIGGITLYIGPEYFSKAGKAEVATARAQLAVLEKALDTWRDDIGRYPTTAEGLDVLSKPLADDGKWNGPYLTQPVTLDPWGNAYLYSSPASRGDFEIISYGKDGKQGGAMDDADIVVGR